MEEGQDEPNETKTQRRLELGRGDEELFAFLSNNIFIDVYLHFKISNGNLYTSTVELILFLVPIHLNFTMGCLNIILN